MTDHLPHPRVGGPQTGHKNVLLLSYLGSQAPNQTAQESIPALGRPWLWSQMGQDSS